jgi:hypothetical protein
MAIEPLVHIELIVTINQSNCLKNLPNFRWFFAMATKKNALLFVKKLFLF